MMRGFLSAHCSAVVGLLAIACGEAALLPMPKALPEVARVRGGARVVLLDADLDLLTDAVRAQVGATLAVAAAPWPVPGSNGHILGPISTDVGLLPGSAEWTNASRLELSMGLQSPPITLALNTPGRAGCAVSWTALAGKVAVAVEFSRGPSGVGPALVAEPIVTWKQPALDGPCVANVDPAVAAALLGHVHATLAAAVAAHVATTALAAVRTVFPPTLELRGRFAFSARGGTALEARVDTAYEAPLAAQPAVIAVHSGSRTEAALSLALDVDRAPCAVDEPPPQWKAAPLPPLPPPNAPGKALLRRALALDRAALQHLAYVATRAGLLCQDAWQGLDTQLPANWADAALPGLGAWVDGPPAGARLWPGRPQAPERASPDVALIDGATGPELLLRLPAATLEILGRVGEVEAVVIVVHGEFRLRLRLTTSVAGPPGLELVAVARGTSQVTSPLLGGTLSPQEPGTGQLVAAAVRGIFARATLLSLGPVPPPGTAVTGTARAGDTLWLWLDGMPVATGP
jgi:hypothetical protein